MSRRFFERLATAALAATGALAACTDRLSLDDRSCPCASDFVCCAATDKCVAASDVATSCPSRSIDITQPRTSSSATSSGDAGVEAASPPSGVPAELLIAGELYPQYLIENRAYYFDYADERIKRIDLNDRLRPPVIVADAPGAYMMSELKDGVPLILGGDSDGSTFGVYTDNVGVVTLPQKLPITATPYSQVELDQEGFFVAGVEVMGATGRLFVSTFPDAPSPKITTRVLVDGIPLGTGCSFPTVRTTRSRRSFASYCKPGQATPTLHRIDADGTVHELGPSSSISVRGENGVWLDDAHTLHITNAITGATRTLASPVSLFGSSESTLVYLSQGTLWAVSLSVEEAPRRLSNDSRLVRIDSVGNAYVMAHDDRGGIHVAALDGSVTNTFLQYGTIQTHGVNMRFTSPFDEREANALYFDEMLGLTMYNLQTRDHVVLSSTADLVTSYGPTNLYWEEPVAPDTIPDSPPLKNVIMFDQVTRQTTRIASGVRPLGGYGAAAMPPVLYAGQGAQGNGLYLARVDQLGRH